MARPEDENKGMRLNGHISRQASEVLERIVSEYGTSKYAIISTALVAYDKFTRGEPMFAQVAPPRKTPAEIPKNKRTQGTRSINAMKTIWCGELGGKVEGNTCHFTKYEMTLAGTVDAMDRALPIDEMPDTKEEFMKYILGGFTSLEEAKTAVVSVSDEND